MRNWLFSLLTSVSVSIYYLHFIFSETTKITSTSSINLSEQAQDLSPREADIVNRRLLPLRAKRRVFFHLNGEGLLGG